MHYEVGKGKPPRATRFKKGKSGDPEGARKHDPLKKLIKLTKTELHLILENILLSSVDDIKDRISNPKVSAVEAIVGKLLIKASKTGNWKVLDSIITILIGRAS